MNCRNENVAMFALLDPTPRHISFGPGGRESGAGQRGPITFVFVLQRGMNIISEVTMSAIDKIILISHNVWWNILIITHIQTGGQFWLSSFIEFPSVRRAGSGVAAVLRDIVVGSLLLVFQMFTKKSFELVGIKTSVP